jgi:hypothetical protein
MMRNDLVGPHMIDYVFTLLPDQAMHAGGSPKGEQWLEVSNHLPVCGSFYFDQIQGTVSKRRKKYLAKPTPSLKLETAVDRAAAEADMTGAWKGLVKGLTIHPPAGSRSA